MGQSCSASWACQSRCASCCTSAAAASGRATAYNLFNSIGWIAQADTSSGQGPGSLFRHQFVLLKAKKGTTTAVVVGVDFSSQDVKVFAAPCTADVLGRMQQLMHAWLGPLRRAWRSGGSHEVVGMEGGPMSRGGHDIINSGGRGIWGRAKGGFMASITEVGVPTSVAGAQAGAGFARVASRLVCRVGVWGDRLTSRSKQAAELTYFAANAEHRV